MDYSLLFKIANYSVLPAWFLLIILPHNRITRYLVHSYIYTIILGIIYITLIVSNWGAGEGGMGSLIEIRKAFGSDEILLAGWIHYLVFDLMIGSWQVRDAKQNGISHWMIIPALILTLFFGPAGLVLYLLLRMFKTHKLII